MRVAGVWRVVHARRADAHIKTRGACWRTGGRGVSLRSADFPDRVDPGDLSCRSKDFAAKLACLLSRTSRFSVASASLQPCSARRCDANGCVSSCEGFLRAGTFPWAICVAAMGSTLVDHLRSDARPVPVLPDLSLLLRSGICPAPANANSGRSGRDPADPGCLCRVLPDLLRLDRRMGCRPART